ncbi:ABC transporter substrate-binding protein [Amycolatopsis thermoflava]|uniref:Peptide/nickel transport system substrate-binding protein n=1 Tax=Amycolatopsis thermoflava TaxID=84480 RepID=A0A3N2H4T9_9PSEU|nr:ABC transporter substrate-binding protein [Amycolatopsis thermoflava]ROS43360.1 peptide/nickel transport system substrate-binding protein [Amycolatopsis thermoflava]
MHGKLLRTQPPRRRRRHLLSTCAAITALSLALTGCADRSSGQGNSTDDNVLSLGISSAPNSLDPAKTGSAFQWYVNLAYDPLIYRAADGALQPRLATSWSYIGSGSKVFEIKLRPDVKFSDGSPLTAEVLRENLTYFAGAPGGSAPYLKQIASVDIVDPLTVRLNLSAPNPNLPDIFSQYYLAGDLVSGQALRTPDILATETRGAGPYVLDLAETVPNDHYTYTPNPHYWNKGDVRYGKVVVKVLSNPNAALAAIKTGQVDVIAGDPTTADAAKTAGLQVFQTPQIMIGLDLVDRTGSMVPALGDVRVRQALNYAIDRDAMAKSLLGGFGMPTEQIALPGTDGYNEQVFYRYDPDKARQLLAEAGYPNGFTMSVMTQTTYGIDQISQAIAADLKKVGVQVELTNAADMTQFVQAIAAGKYPAYGFGYGYQPVFLMGPGLYLPSAGFFNPLKSTDPQLDALYSQAATADQASLGQVNKQIVGRLVELGWFVPAVFAPNLFFARSGVSGISISPNAPMANPVDFRPATS